MISAIIVLGIQKDVLSESTYTRSFHLFACNYYSMVIFAFLPIFSPSCCLSSCWSLFSQQLVSSQPSSVSPLSHPPSANNSSNFACNDGTPAPFSRLFFEDKCFQGFEQSRHIDRRRGPDTLYFDVAIFMRQHVALPDDLTPGNFRVFFLKFF